jgi:prepilin-type N-terminal cleavage/methylation domain-containing protein
VNNRGFGLIEVMIVAAILFIILLASSQLMSYQNKIIRSSELSVQWLQLQLNAQQTLGHLPTCTVSLTGQPIDNVHATDVSFTDAGGYLLKAGVVRGGLRLNLVTLTVLSVLNPSQVVAKMTWQVEKVGSFIGNRIMNASFPVQLNVGAGTVIGCF